MKWKSLFAAALAAAVAWPALAQDATGGGTPAEGGGLQQPAGTTAGRVISVNFGGGQSGVSPYAIPADTAYGLVSATNWNNTTASTGETIALNASDGTDSGATLTYAANGTWNDDAASTDPFLQYFLGDNREGGTTITVSNVPFDTYDVIVYVNSDTADTSFLPVAVNDVKYIGDPETGATVVTDNATATFGQTRADAPQYGLNTIRVNGITRDTLAILGSRQQTIDNVKRRCNIAGFQIVESVPLSISVNLKGTANVNFPYYPETLVGDTTGFSGLVPVVNANWNEVETPAGDGSTPEIIGAKDSTGAETTATINLAIGGGWTLKGLSQEVQNARTTRIGKMGLGYADASKNATPEVTLKDIPYTKYSVILYYATDNQNMKWAPAKVTAGDIVTYYYYDADGTLKSDGTSTSTWGSSNDCIAAATTGTLGKDTMRIDNLSGDVSIDLDTSSNSGNTRGGLSGFQIVCTGEVVGALAPSSVMSLNFASGGTGNISESKVSEQTGNFGLAAAPAETWVDLEGETSMSGQKQTVTTLHGEADVENWTSATVTWSAKNSYSYTTGQVTGETEPFLKTYLDDGDGDSADGIGASVTVSTLPFKAYDVIVYNATDSGKAFYPVTVNNVKYTWDATSGITIATEENDATYGPNVTHGVSGLPTATLGTNALRVNGLTADSLSIQGVGTNISGSSETYVRAGIAAVQIVARKLITVSTQTNWATLSAGLSASDPVLIVFQDGGSITGDVTLPADTILDFSDYTFGETAPFTGSLTLAGGTIRLPERFDSAKIAASISGSFTCFIGNELVWLSNQDGTLSLSYEWSGYGGDNLWSNPYNWSSRLVPDKNAEVSFTLGTGEEVVILDEAATVASVTITGTENASLEIQATNGGSLTVSGQMLTTGNVTVTQSADITVRGATKTGVFYPGTQYETTQPVQAGFHVHQGTWQILSGTLSVPTDGGNLTGEAGISGDGTLIVGGEGASDAKLAVHQLSHIFYNETLSLAYGTLRVAAGGTLTASNAVSLAVNYGHTYTVDLDGGTIETPTLATFAGVTVSDDSSLRAPNGGTLNVTLPRGSSGDALTGTGGVTLSGTVTIPSELTDYTGTLTVSAGSALTLSANARPSLVLVSGATEAKTSLTVTRTDDEAESGTIVFPTTMTAAPTNVTYTVNGLDEEEKKTLSVDVSEGQLTLSWEVKRPTLSTTSDWSTTDNWTNLPDGTTPTYPTSDSVTLDGTKSPITVTLNTDLSEMTYIFVKGNVTLVTTNDQPTIPACVALGEGATLTIGADFSGLGNDKKWTLPAGRTLQVTKGFTSFAYLTLNGKTVILEGASGSDGEPNTIEASNASDFVGGLTIQASNLKLTSMYHVGTVLELLGENIRIEGLEQLGEKDPVFYTNAGTQVVNRGSGNEITNLTGHNGSLAVETGSLKLTHQRAVVSNFTGATIAGDATLTLAGPANAQQWWFPATGEGTLVLEGAYRPMFSAVSQEATTLPKNMVFTATAAEQAAGLISCLNNNHSAKLPEDFTVKVNPAEGGGAWAPNPVLVQGGNSYLQIYNQLPTNLPAGVDEAVATAIQQAAKNAGIENKGYAVQLRTKGGQTTIASPDAETLNDVLGCFDNLTATADTDKTTLTYAYDFGIVGIKRNTTGDGWVVTAKVQGEGAAQAGFAAGNVYTLTVNGAPAADASATVGENGTVTFTVPDASVAGETCTLGVKVARPAAQP